MVIVITELVESAPLGSFGLLGKMGPHPGEKEMGLTCVEEESPVNLASCCPTMTAWDPQLPEPVGPCL